MNALSPDQLNALLWAQWNLYELQRIYGVGDVLRPAMDVVQRQTRALASGGGVPPVAADPEASFLARAAVGQNCAWGNLLTPAEQNWAVAKWGGEASLRVNAYASGGANVMERPAVGGGYEFVTFPEGVETWRPDTGGPLHSTADAYCAEVMSPNALPGPLPKP